MMGQTLQYFQNKIQTTVGMEGDIPGFVLFRDFKLRSFCNQLFIIEFMLMGGSSLRLMQHEQDPFPNDNL